MSDDASKGPEKRPRILRDLARLCDELEAGIGPPPAPPPVLPASPSRSSREVKDLLVVLRRIADR